MAGLSRAVLAEFSIPLADALEPGFSFSDRTEDTDFVAPTITCGRVHFGVGMTDNIGDDNRDRPAEAVLLIEGANVIRALPNAFGVVGHGSYDR